MATHVYAMKSADGPIKIGVSRNPDQRREELQREFAASITVVGSAIVYNRRLAFRAEKIAHRILAAVRIKGEWFDVTKEEAIDAINRAIEVVQSEYRQWPLRLNSVRPEIETQPEPKATKLIGVWMTDTMVARLDKYRGGQTRPQAIRALLERHLK